MTKAIGSTNRIVIRPRCRRRCASRLTPVSMGLDSQPGRGAGIAGMEMHLPIGEFASRVGLTISALRFYDDATVLKPVRVDGQTGYRYYSPGQVQAGRLLSQLRAAGMPLALVREVLGAPPERARHLIDDHRRQVERRLEDARSSACAAIRLLAWRTR